MSLVQGGIDFERDMFIELFASPKSMCIIQSLFFSTWHNTTSTRGGVESSLTCKNWEKLAGNCMNMFGNCEVVHIMTLVYLIY